LVGVKISCLPRVGEERVLPEGRHLRERVEPEVAPLELALTQVAPLSEGDGLARADKHGEGVTVDDVL
jgi:hypothetical protein